MIEILDFYADWCGPCRMLGKTLDNVEDKYGDRVIIHKYNIDLEENKETMDKYGIKSIPALVIISSDGSEKKTGILSYDELCSIIDGKEE